MSKITKSARGEECLVGIDYVCNHDPETVVFAHRNGGGMGMKVPDLFGAYCCSACHDAIDGRVRHEHLGRDLLELYFLQGVERTQRKLLDKGLVTID